MQQNNADPRSDTMKRTMANHFAENEGDYRDADWAEIVYEDDSVVVVADHKGYEFDEWQTEFGDGFGEMMHDLARQVTDHSWSTHYPLVFDKLVDHDYAGAEVNADDVVSTFQQLNLEHDSRFPSYVTAAYEGTLVFDDVAVTSTYSVERHEHGTERIAVYRRYEVAGEEVNVSDDTWELADDGETVAHTDKGIEAFCESDHESNQTLEIEFAMGQA